MSQAARITGVVEYREGDGPNIAIRPGPCEIEATALDVTLSWDEEESRHVAALPLSDFRRYLANGDIRLIN